MERNANIVRGADRLLATPNTSYEAFKQYAGYNEWRTAFRWGGGTGATIEIAVGKIHVVVVEPDGKIWTLIPEAKKWTEA